MNNQVGKFSNLANLISSKLKDLTIQKKIEFKNQMFN